MESFCWKKLIRDLLTLQVPTLQNDQTHPNNSLVNLLVYVDKVHSLCDL